jgi:hypothetical protein
MDYLAKCYGAKLKIKASSSWAEPFTWLSKDGISVTFDDEHADYYRHGYGSMRLNGKNANLAIQPSNLDDWYDIGNIILIERDRQQYAIEVAVGIETFCAHLNGQISAIFSNISNDEHTYSIVNGDLITIDVLNTVCHIILSDIRPFSSNRGRILRRYLDLLAQRLAYCGVDTVALVRHCGAKICKHRGIYRDPEDWDFLISYLIDRSSLPSKLSLEEKNQHMARIWASRWPRAWGGNDTYQSCN